MYMIHTSVNIQLYKLTNDHQYDYNRKCSTQLLFNYAVSQMMDVLDLNGNET